MFTGAQKHSKQPDVTLFGLQGIWGVWGRVGTVVTAARRRTPRWNRVCFLRVGGTFGTGWKNFLVRIPTIFD